MEVLYVHNEVVHNFSAANEILPFIIETFNPSSMLDIGCGIGTWLKVAKDLGVKEVIGVDGAYTNRALLKINADEFAAKDLRKSFFLERKFDLALCLEVAEHLPQDAAVNLITTLCAHSDTVIFSAAIPGQGGQNHNNEQWPEYWVKLFAERGHVAYDMLRPQFWENEKVDYWYRQNMLVFSNRKIPESGKQAETAIHAYIHPELFKKKLEEINQLQQKLFDVTQNPGVRQSFVNFLKALKRKLIC